LEKYRKAFVPDKTNNEWFKEQTKAYIVEEKSTIKEVSDKYEVDFLNAGRVAETSLIDCIHLDEKNHEKLAKYITSKVSEVLDYEEAR